MKILGAFLVLIIASPAFVAGMLYGCLRTGFVAGAEAIDRFGDRLAARKAKSK